LAVSGDRNSTLVSWGEMMTTATGIVPPPLSQLCARSVPREGVCEGNFPERRGPRSRAAGFQNPAIRSRSAGLRAVPYRQAGRRAQDQGTGFGRRLPWQHCGPFP
jgi:hypothetical protein